MNDEAREWTYKISLEISGEHGPIATLASNINAITPTIQAIVGAWLDSMKPQEPPRQEREV